VFSPAPQFFFFTFSLLSLSSAALPYEKTDDKEHL